MESYTAPSGARIHVSPDEQAGIRVLARGGPKDRERMLWSFLAAEFDYDTVLDLGANYGQVSLEFTYPEDVRIILVEANPGLLPFLERSIETHPNRGQIDLRGLALGDHEGTAKLFVRTDAVGKSSFVRERGDPIEVELGTVDALVPSSPRWSDAIIKVDVEGSELAVLEGAAKTLGGLENYAIMVELHPDFMRRTAGSVGRFLEKLCAYGYLWERKTTGIIKPFDLYRFVRRDKLDDILIVSGDAYTARIRDFNRSLRKEPSTPAARASSRTHLRRWARRMTRVTGSR